jgi:hypothetical protein
MFSFFKKKEAPQAQEIDSSGPIFPRIKTPQFIQTVSQLQGIKEEQMPVVAGLAGDLLLTFAVDMGAGYLTVTHEEMARRGTNIESMYAEALRNARPLLANLQMKGDGTLHKLEVGNDMEACLMLFGAIWSNVQETLNDTPIAIFPHRNAAFFTGKNTPGGLSGLQEILSAIDFNQTHALSKMIFEWNGVGWGVLES